MKYNRGGSVSVYANAIVGDPCSPIGRIIRWGCRRLGWIAYDEDWLWLALIPPFTEEDRLFARLRLVAMKSNFTRSMDALEWAARERGEEFPRRMGE